MTRLKWGEPGRKIYEIGVDRGVLYPEVGPGVAWDGLISISENSSGGEVQGLYYDGVKYLDYVTNEDFDASLQAFSAPAEFAACDGSKQIAPGLYATQQPRKTFGLSYRTLIGNDTQGPDFGYKLHLVWGCTAAPSSRELQTLGGNSGPGARTWDISTVPPTSSTYKPTAHFMLDSTQVEDGVLADLESYLYGREGFDAELPSQTGVLELLANKIGDLVAATI